RSCRLLTLLCALSLLFFLRIREGATTRSLVGWTVTSALALCAHYFAAFLIVPEAIVILVRVRDRRALGAIAGVAAVAVALAPLAIYQQAHSGTDWITTRPLGMRIKGVAAFDVTGLDGRGIDGQWAVPTLLIALAAGWMLVRAGGAARRR